ncbi:hypothetical protein CPB84DRAFT_1773781 [Gymnopilus junonius]|uniref:Uncharacterized protein n=1 Tax=Gymnopilus junonius TaxID=109634 RepID=A0A9P5TNU6_GYMJU|nr:hypothetical protein CPB84DRAFT_1773781 [Gymnopilus junonius]
MGQLPSCFRTLARIVLSWFSSPQSTKLYNKAVDYFTSYLSSKNPDDLENALSNYNLALEAGREERKFDPADVLVNYAMALWMKYEQDGQPPEILAKIVEFDEEALSLWRKISPKPEDYPILLFNLANAYFTQYASSDDLALFESITQLCGELGSMTGVKNETRAKGLLILGKALNTKCDRDKKTDHLDESIGLFVEALDLTKPSNKVEGSAEDTEDRINDLVALQIQVECLYNLATAYEIRYQLTENKRPEDLDKAIQYNYDVKELIPNDHPNRPSCLFNLARQLFTRYESIQKEKAGGSVLLDVNLDIERGVPDLKAADKIAKEVRTLLSGADPSLGLRQNVDDLLMVIGKHEEALTKSSFNISGSRSSSRMEGRSRNPSPNPSQRSFHGSTA